jgi:hypothetical protein
MQIAMLVANAQNRWKHKMKNILIHAALVFALSSTVPHAQTAAPAQPAPTPQEQPVPAGATAPVSDGLSDLGTMTFGCPRAGLNAAAREAAKIRSQGTYQFSYFRIVNDSHHAAYEVHFKSNYLGEADVKYCVSVYCQQGWDPKTTKVSVEVIDEKRKPATGVAHGTMCHEQTPVKRGVKR